jgi:hypothetical protein
MDANKDFLFAIFIILAIGVLWAVTGGPERARQNQSILLRGPGSTHSKIESSKSPSTVIDTTEKKSEEPMVDVDKTLGEISKFKDKITINKSSSGPKNKTPETEYLTLNISSGNTEDISLMGWRIESKVTGKSFTIGGATEVYISGVVNSEPPIKASPGESVIILTGRSPIGSSFKINKCVGYFEQFQDFSPRLSTNCPSLKNELEEIIYEIPLNDNVCEDFVNRIRRCEMPLSSFPIGMSNECVEFISENINYTGCVKSHRDDLDFLGKEWRVFLGRTEEIWREKREIIRLIDNDGMVVDTYTY